MFWTDLVNAKRRVKLKAWSWFVLIVCLVILSIFLSACKSGATAVPVNTPLASAQGTPDLLPSVHPYPPSLPETMLSTQTPYTPPPVQTLIPTLAPAATSRPTSLPFPPPAFDVLWVENLPGPAPDESTGVVWRADPRDIANRTEVVRLDGKTIERASISPNGRYVALVTRGRLEGGGPVWVMNVDGSALRQVAPLGREILWGPDSLALFYSVDKAASAAIERIDLNSGEILHIPVADVPIPLQLLGWSSGEPWLYYFRLHSEDQGLWKVRQDGTGSQFVTSLEVGYPPLPVLLSPQGNRLLIGPHWISLVNQEKGDIQLPRSARGGQILWGNGSREDNEVLVGQGEQKTFYLYSIDIPSGQAQEIARFDIPTGPGWYQLGLSPDREWLMANIYHGGAYWVHLSSGMIIPVSPYDSGTYLIAWIPRGTDQ